MACYLVVQRSRFRYQSPDKVRFYDRTRTNFLPQPFVYPPPSLSEEGEFIGYPLAHQSLAYCDRIMEHLRAISYNPFSQEGFSDRRRCLDNTRDMFRQFALNMPNLFRSAPRPLNVRDDLLTADERYQLLHVHDPRLAGLTVPLPLSIPPVITPQVTNSYACLLVNFH